MNDDLFSDALRQLLAAECSLQRVRDIEGGQPAAPLWALLEESGFADALVPEAQGGAGLRLPEAYPLLELCGTCAVPVPLAETMLARALLAQCDVQRPAGSISFAPSVVECDGGRLSCERVPYGQTADWVMTSQGQEGLLLPAQAASRSPAVSCLESTLEWSAEARAGALRFALAHDLRTLQACICAAQLAGALASVFERTLQYANERNQFGRPIGKFQAIQHQLSLISEHASAARMAAQIGCQASGAMPERLRVAVAKARASEAALEVAALSHSIHGAIGFTEEFDLQLYTRRLHGWRQTAGSESYWHDVIGAELVDHREGPSLDLLRATTDLH